MPIVIAIVAVVVVLAIVAIAVPAMRRRSLQQRFGPEYDRAVADQSNRSDAEKELREREQRHSELELTELDPQQKQHYTDQWQAVQADFVDNPGRAVNAADDLISRIMADRGYPTGDFDEQAAHLSVDHSQLMQDYREAHRVALAERDGQAGTEDLRLAFVRFRTVAAELLGTAAPNDDERNLR